MADVVGANSIAAAQNEMHDQIVVHERFLSDIKSIVTPFLRQHQAHVTKILLIRHGHVEGIKPEQFRGGLTSP